MRSCVISSDRHAHHAADRDGVVGHARRVVEGVGRLRVDHVGERGGDAVEILVARGADRRAGIERRRRSSGSRASSSSSQIGSLVGDRAGRRRRAPGRTSVRAGRAPSHGRPGTPKAVRKTSTVCAMHAMRARWGISAPRRPRGRPLPSQCSSSARTASAASGGKPRLATIRAPRSQRASTISPPLWANWIAATITSRARDRAPSLRRCVLFHEASAPRRGGTKSTSLPARLSSRSSPPPKISRHSRRRAGAAGVLEQQRVVEAAAILSPAARRSRASRMPSRQVRPGVAAGLALGQIEGVGERGDDLRERDVSAALSCAWKCEESIIVVYRRALRAT